MGVNAAVGGYKKSDDSLAIGPGWVYVLSNQAHPHLLKIGFSTDTPASRAIGISASTGVPFSFVVEFKIYVAECGGLEAAVHRELSRYRINQRREFFKVTVDEAARCISRVAARFARDDTLVAFIREAGKFRRVRAWEITSRAARNKRTGYLEITYDNDLSFLSDQTYRLPIGQTYRLPIGPDIKVIAKKS